MPKVAEALGPGCVNEVWIRHDELNHQDYGGSELLGRPW
jgi:hypothetical protein